MGYCKCNNVAYDIRHACYGGLLFNAMGQAGWAGFDGPLVGVFSWCFNYDS